MRRVIGNPVLDNALQTLRVAWRSSRSPIWRAAIKMLMKTRSRRVEVNVGKIDKLSKDGDVILVPGKVLGGGTVSHSIVVGCFNCSKAASDKIRKAGGKALTLTEFVEKYRDGKGVLLIGG